MSTTRLIAVSIILGSLEQATDPREASADHNQEIAIERLKAFGGKVDAYACPPAQASWSPPAKSPSLSEPKTIRFFNTNLTDLDLASVSDALLQIENIKRIDLSYTKLKGESLGRLAGIASLEELDLSSTPITGDGLIELTLLGHLNSIGLNDTYLPRDSFVYFQSRFAESLKSLQFSGSQVFEPRFTPLGANEILRVIRRFCALESLDLSRALTTPGSSETDLQSLTTLKNLRELDLSNNNLKDTAIPKDWNLSKFTVLSLAGNTELTNKGLAFLWPTNPDCPLEPLDFRLSPLKKLNLSGTRLTDAGLEAIAKRYPQLAELVISGTRTLVSSSAAASLGHLATLKRLNISNTGVDDAVFRVLWKGDKLSALGALDISGTMVTDRGLITQTPHPDVGFKSLAIIYCADTKVTTGGVNRRNALLASHPPSMAALNVRETAGASRPFAEASRRDYRMPP